MPQVQGEELIISPNFCIAYKPVSEANKTNSGIQYKSVALKLVLSFIVRPNI